MWVEKYRPSNPHHMVGNDDSRRRFLEWLKNWGGKREGKPIPILILGPPGTGKTSLVHASAKLLGYTVLELNASDIRTKDRLERVIGPVTTMSSVLGEKVLLFLDEVDGIYGRQDYGGLEFLTSVLIGCPVPLVLAANLEDDERIKKLASKCEVLRMRRIPPRIMEIYLSNLARREGIEVSREALESVVRLSQGDIRAAVNNLQSLAHRVTSEGAARDVDVTLRQGLISMFNSGTPEEGMNLLSKVDFDPREFLRTVYASIVSSKLDSEELALGMKKLSDSDALLGRILRTQNWSLYRYFRPLIVHGIFKSISKGKIAFNNDPLPWNLKLRIWNESRALREVGKKLATLLHCSSKDAMTIYLPYLLLVISSRVTYQAGLHRILALDESSEKVLSKEMTRVSGALK